MRRLVYTVILAVGCHHGAGSDAPRSPSQTPTDHVTSLEVVAESVLRHGDGDCVALASVLASRPRPTATDAIQRAIVRDTKLDLRATRALDVIETGYMRCRNDPTFLGRLDQLVPVAP